MSIEQKIEEYYDYNIGPLFKGYASKLHKIDCVELIKMLYDNMKSEEITYQEWKSDNDESKDIYENYCQYMSDIPLYLENVTGTESMEILAKRQDALVKFVTSLYQ